jgi:hypothetical protein
MMEQEEKGHVCGTLDVGDDAKHRQRETALAELPRDCCPGALE